MSKKLTALRVRIGDRDDAMLRPMQHGARQAVTQHSVAARKLAIDLYSMCRDRLDGGMGPEDVATTLVRVLAHITVKHDLGGGEVQKRLAATLAVARARKETKANMEAGRV